MLLEVINGLFSVLTTVTSVTVLWGYSSVGRAPALQAGGQEFESPYLHHYDKMS